MLKCKDKKWYQFWSVSGEEQRSVDYNLTDLPSAHLDSLWLPPIRLSTQPSLQVFFTESLGIFFPSTMLNTVFTSVWGWNWGVGQGRWQTTLTGKKRCLFMFKSLFVQSPLRGNRLARAPGDSLFSFAKTSFTVATLRQLSSHPMWLRISNQVTELLW